MPALTLAFFATLAFPQGIVVDRISAGHRTGVCDMSDDGQVVVGYGSSGAESSNFGFLWTKGSGLKALPLHSQVRDAFSFVMATEISGDGKVIGGNALWLRPGARIGKRFPESALALTSLAKLPISDMFVGPINRDGTTMVLKVEAQGGPKLFRWHAGRKDLERLVDSKGAQVFGSAHAISDDGRVVGGTRFGSVNEPGFLFVGSKYHDVRPPKGYTQATIWNLTNDGKVAFGRYGNGGSDEISFRWTLGKGKPQLLPAGFIIEAVTQDGSVAAGWMSDKPALLVRGNVVPLSQVMGAAYEADTMDDLRIVSIRRAGSNLLILGDTDDAPHDYRISLPMSLVNEPNSG